MFPVGHVGSNDVTTCCDGAEFGGAFDAAFDGGAETLAVAAAVIKLGAATLAGAAAAVAFVVGVVVEA